MAPKLSAKGREQTAFLFPSGSGPAIVDISADGRIGRTVAPRLLPDHLAKSGREEMLSAISNAGYDAVVLPKHGPNAYYGQK